MYLEVQPPWPMPEETGQIGNYPASAAILVQLFAFAGFLLMPGFIFKLVFVIFVNLFNTGWYPILQGRLYSSLPGQSTSIMAIGSVTAPIAKFFPFMIGFLADRFGLQTAMWILLLGPFALLIGLPRNNGQPKMSNL